MVVRGAPDVMVRDVPGPGVDRNHQSDRGTKQCLHRATADLWGEVVEMPPDPPEPQAVARTLRNRAFPGHTGSV